MAPLACRGYQALPERRVRLETSGPWVPMELQVLGVPMAPADQRALQGCREESVNQAPWVRRVNRGSLETQDLQEPQASWGPKEKLVKRGTQAHLGLPDPRARKVPLVRMAPKGTWAPQDSPETWGLQETLEFRV